MVRHVFYCCSLALLIGACTSEGTGPTEPRLPDLEAGVWTRLSPGGETTCADGSPYAYFATPGSVNKLVIDFQGGGACWNAATCGAGLYDRSVDAGDAPSPVGIYDRANSKNPVRDWYHVLIPYCTGDIHAGDAVTTYSDGAGGEFSLRHRGAVNVRAVFDWIFTTFEAPESIFVTGCSAGAYGAILWLPEVRRNYPNADIYQLGDCGAGIVTEGFVENGLPNWNFNAALPDYVLGLDPDAPGFTLDADLLTRFYSAIGNTYPDARLSQYNTVADGVQISFLAYMKGEASPSNATVLEWTTRMPDALAAIEGSTANFRSYTSTFDDNGEPADGTAHCIIVRPEFYTVQESGRPLVNWLDDLINEREVSSVAPTAP